MTKFPDNKRFAFTVFDDTDYSTVSNIEPIYRLLTDLGFRTTKSVWPLGPVLGARIGGDSLQNKNYRSLVLSLQREGFEIGLHNVQNHDATRQETEQGLEVFRSLIGMYPRIHCNHSLNKENIYWGDQRLSRPISRLGYNLATRFSRHNYFEGHRNDSPYFWGDLCKERITYVRNFVFKEINLDLVDPTMPYHDPAKPFVNFWFSSSEGSTVDRFCKMLSEANQNRLEAEGGVCIMYTHFARGFCERGLVNAEFKRLMQRLARMDGWFVPVATLLDHLRNRRRAPCISRRALARMERRWFFTKLQNGRT